MYFDTLTVTENLITAVMPDGQAKAIAREYANLMQHQVDQFSTKSDINRLNTKIDTKIHELDAKIDVKFHELGTKIDTKFGVWMWRMMFNMWGIAATVAGLLFAAIRLF